MKNLPNSRDALVLRTDFSDDSAWEALRAAIRTPVDGFQAYVEFVDDREYAGAMPGQLLGCVPRDADHTFLFIVDRETLSHPDRPVLVMDLHDEPGRTFRVTPSGMISVENNLSIANMGFGDYAESVDPDGVFRGFEEL